MLTGYINVLNFKLIMMDNINLFSSSTKYILLLCSCSEPPSSSSAPEQALGFSFPKPWLEQTEKIVWSSHLLLIVIQLLLVLHHLNEEHSVLKSISFLNLWHRGFHNNLGIWIMSKTSHLMSCPPWFPACAGCCCRESRPLARFLMVGSQHPVNNNNI